MGNDLKKYKLLISGLGGSLFPYLHDQLKSKYELYYLDSDPTLKELYQDYNFFVAPPVTSPEYKVLVKQVVDQYKIDVYIPLIDEEIPVAHALVKEISGLALLSPRESFCSLASEKDRLMKKLEEEKISFIPSWNGQDFKWSGQKEIFVKPIYGRGSRGIRRIQNEKELEAYYTLEKYLPSEILVQEYVKGTEYTVGVLTNTLDEIISISTKKILKKRGITIKAITETNPLIEETVVKLNKVLKPQGAINVQLYITPDNEVKIFEINPRFSTTTVMSYAAGIDEIGLWIEYYKKSFNSEIIRPAENIILQRRWENIFYERQ